MSVYHVTVPVAEPLKEASRTLDVREQESDGRSVSKGRWPTTLGMACDVSLTNSEEGHRRGRDRTSLRSATAYDLIGLTKR